MAVWVRVAVSSMASASWLAETVTVRGAFQRLLPLALKVSVPGLAVTSVLSEAMATVTGPVGCVASLTV